MKWLLNFFPRPWLIQWSYFFRPFLRWWFRGHQLTDPIDGSHYRKFLPYGYQNLRKNALCPGTLSLERHRLLWLYLKRHTSFLDRSISVLHVAPEQIFFDLFKTFQHWTYTTTDLYSPLADVRADLCALPMKDNSYDLILCNHVLEHIVEDTKAMKELYRVLKVGGTLIAQVPLEMDRSHTYEDFSILDPEERAEAFGQYDHVRVYGRDFFDRLQKAGFSMTSPTAQDICPTDEIVRFALLKDEVIPVAMKQ